MNKIAIIFILMLSIGHFCSAQCKSEYLKRNPSPTDYQSRGRYCEGFLSPEASQPVINLVHFTVGNFNFQPTATEQITLKLGSPVAQNVAIEATNIDPNHQAYRLDAILTGINTLTWKVRTVLLEDDNLRNAENVAIRAFYRRGNDTIYCPIITSSRLQGAGNRQNLVMKFVGDAAYRELTYNIEHTNMTGTVSNGRMFIAGSPIIIKIPIANLTKGRLYKLTLDGKIVGGTLDDRFPITIIWFKYG